MDDSAARLREVLRKHAEDASSTDLDRWASLISVPFVLASASRVPESRKGPATGLDKLEALNKKLVAAFKALDAEELGPDAIMALRPLRPDDLATSIAVFNNAVVEAHRTLSAGSSQPTKLGRPEKTVAKAATRAAGRAFQEMTGKPPTWAKSEKKHSESEPSHFGRFLSDIFEALCIDAKPEHFARSARKGKK